MKEHFKKQAETDQVMRLKENLTGFPEGDIVPGESPDFTVEATGGRIGIEVVGLFRNELDSGGLPRRARERLQDKSLWEAKRLYEARTEALPFVEVGVHWSPHAPVAKARLGEIAGALADLVATNLPDQGDHARLGYPHPVWKTLPKEVDHLFVSCPASLPENAWGSSRGDAVPTLIADGLQEAIDGKEGKLASYRKSRSEVWLLIVSDGLAPSNNFELAPEVERTRFSTGFDRVFYMHYSKGLVLELHTDSRK